MLRNTALLYSGDKVYSFGGGISFSNVKVNHLKLLILGTNWRKLLSVVEDENLRNDGILEQVGWVTVLNIIPNFQV